MLIGPFADGKFLQHDKNPLKELFWKVESDMIWATQILSRVPFSADQDAPNMPLQRTPSPQDPRSPVTPADCEHTVEILHGTPYLDERPGVQQGQWVWCKRCGRVLAW